jgi:hypothetical protein
MIELKIFLASGEPTDKIFNRLADQLTNWYPMPTEFDQLMKHCMFGSPGAVWMLLVIGHLDNE